MTNVVIDMTMSLDGYVPGRATGRSFRWFTSRRIS